jgi:hypothetical protein
MLTDNKISMYTNVISQRIGNSRSNKAKLAAQRHPSLSNLPYSFNFLIALHLFAAATAFLVIVSLSCYLLVYAVCDSRNKPAQVASVQYIIKKN